MHTGISKGLDFWNTLMLKKEKHVLGLGKHSIICKHSALPSLPRVTGYWTGWSEIGESFGSPTMIAGP